MADADPQLPLLGPLRTIDLIRERAVDAVLGQSRMRHEALTAEIRRRFGGTDVEQGALVREPIIEGAAPFITDGRTFADCAGTLLHPDVIKAISSEGAGEYRFPPDAQPYRHQIEAWQHLTHEERRSVLVSSGTGSGKTECFLMPLLDDLAREAETKGRLSGVRAIALYPLNALIASQEERLRAWTRPLAGKVRFGLYNGLTPEKLREQDKPGREQVGDRVTLRADPPPILVTNVTMLEYLTVRRIDRPLIENSRGLLRWIILDEAHGYVGSAAAEIALLLRRVLLTFGAEAQNVRFVATSATIGDGRDVTDDLRYFLRDISGADDARVRVVLGAREEVELPMPSAHQRLEDSDLFDRETVRANPSVQKFIRAAEARPLRLDEAQSLLAPTGQPIESTLRAIANDSDRQRAPLLPLRVHAFIRAIPGLWSCLNPACGNSPDGWPFGAVLGERVDACPTCTAPVLEIATCRECGEPWLDCEEQDGQIRARYTPPTLDEFAALRERELTSDDDAEQDPAASEPLYDAERLVIAGRALPGCHVAHVVPTTGQRRDAQDDETAPFYTHSADSCAACDAHSGKLGGVMRPFRFGAPFLIGNAAPVLLEGVRPRETDNASTFRPPADGRQLLSFTDSRQGTARFAANLQTNAERGFVRGFVYHSVQGSMAPAAENDPEVASRRKTIADLEPLVAASPQIAETVKRLKGELSLIAGPSVSGIGWTELRSRLAAADEVRKWMRDVWQFRDSRFRSDVEKFSEFLLLREFARRPRRANTAETLGLTRLRFEIIERINTAPDALQNAGKSVEEWRGLLYTMIDMIVRANLAVRIDDNDVHWITHRGWRKELLPFGETSGFTSLIAWPRSRATAISNLLLILEKGLGLSCDEARDRALIDEVLEASWHALSPLFSDPTRPGYALDFNKAQLAPVTQGWLCPVTGRVLAETALGFTPYGHREGLRPANASPRPLRFPKLPTTFPRGQDVGAIRAWLANDSELANLRGAGVWSDLQDRAALLSPYLRAAEHSAQQPPTRLRRFEAEFKAGEINVLNCSTTMEMGVDIGSVSAVMMTNVPPALANYRQRVGRAGRRRQGFATSLTYTRDTPLDREAFRNPEAYLVRQTRAPRVKLDSRRISQRHVNAHLLARWFASAGGEALKSRTGDFFGCPEGVGADRIVDAPVELCLSWLRAPSTSSTLRSDIAALTRGTALDGDSTVFDAAAEALSVARDGVVGEWEAMQAQAATAPPEGRKGIEYQLRRMARENLLGELAVRNFLPAHGLPTAVVPFVNADKPAADDGDADRDDASRRRRSFPSRTLDIAIRDYAPGAEVVVDGLVYRSAGVTLNWQRPADDADAHEIQSLKVFWTCPACGAADTGHVAPVSCPSCRADVPLEAQRRFLQASGFTADMNEEPHADTNEVTYVEPEQEQIVARGAAWQPFANPTDGRLRSSSEGLVFFSSRGSSKNGYHVCLECGRAEPAGSNTTLALKDHLPLRGTRRNAAGVCPGNDLPFKITVPIALGCETITDVAEFQPVGLVNEGAAWAAISALREALARRLGVETGEMGMAVRRALGPLGQPTHSLYLFDRSAGGAGFSTAAVGLYEELVSDAHTILDCEQPGCVHGCSACVLTADLFKHQEIIDRKAALAWAEQAMRGFAQVPPEEHAGPGARLCRSVADGVAAAVNEGARELLIWIGDQSDVAGLSEQTFVRFVRRLGERGVKAKLAFSPSWLEALDPAARLALRDASKTLDVSLHRSAAPTFPNGATAIAAIDGPQPRLWVSRDPAPGSPGETWGQGQERPVVSVPKESLPLVTSFDPDSLLPASGTRFIEIGDGLDGPIADFGRAFAKLVAPAVRAAGGTSALSSITYNDRYIQSPLVARLLTEALDGLRVELAGRADMPLRIVTNRLKPNQRQPFAPDHDWEWEEDRREVLEHLLSSRGFQPSLVEQAAEHGRTIVLGFVGGQNVRVVLDQGFGPWRTPRFARFDFAEPAERQALKLGAYSALIAARGTTYIVVTA